MNRITAMMSALVQSTLWSKPSGSKLGTVAVSLMNPVALKLKENWMVLTWERKKKGQLWVELGRSVHGWSAYFSTVSWLAPSDGDEHYRMGYLGPLLLLFFLYSLHWLDRRPAFLIVMFSNRKCLLHLALNILRIVLNLICILSWLYKGDSKTKGNF